MTLGASASGASGTNVGAGATFEVVSAVYASATVEVSTSAAHGVVCDERTAGEITAAREGGAAAEEAWMLVAGGKEAGLERAAAGLEDVCRGPNAAARRNDLARGGGGGRVVGAAT